MDGRMTEGPIARQLIRFSIPLILSGLLQQLYSWADALIVGNFAGEAALAAIGATNAVHTLYVALLAGFSVGVSILVSRAYGERDDAAVTRTSSTFLLLLTAMSLGLVAIGLLLSRPLLVLLGTPEEIMNQALEYLRIMMLGLPFLAAYNCYNAVLRGIGDSRTPLLAIIVSSLLNVALDLLFVGGFGWGVAGAAVATVLSQALMVVFLIVYVPRRHTLLRLPPRRSMVDKTALRGGLSLSLPTTLQSGVRSIGALMLQNVQNSFGAQVIAAITTAYRIDMLGLLPTTNIGAGISTFTAQNHGAGQLDRARRGLWIGSAIAFVTSLVTTVIFVLAGETLMRLFGVSEGAVRIGRDFLHFCAVFYPIFGVQTAFIGYLQGMGDVRFAAFATISSLAMRVVLSYAFAGIAGHAIIAYSEMASWVYCLILCVGRYWFRFRKGKLDDPPKAAG
ncbi:MATE family efflux transporter [Eubacteriales bacterium OttesenSCG-928-A19]|nr:MATE family efflux transporter [Eubacteriales bacterium OttesenSCG-928-A19]